MGKKFRPLAFDWDKNNKDKNWVKHKVDFRECEQVFLNRPFKIFPDRRHSQKELRFLSFGVTNKGRKLTIIFTLRNQKVRIISARNQNRKERGVYE